MDKKKLIGTIVGVTLFAALIAGATFAWFTITLNVSQGNYVGRTQNFVIDYDKGTELTTVPMVSSGTGTNSEKLVVSAVKMDETMAGTLYIYLKASNDNFLRSRGVLHYAVCSGSATASDCTGDITTTSGPGVLSVGAITGEDTTLHTVPFTASTLNTRTYYWIHFWLDGDDMNNDYLGLTFNGYIHASATQSAGQ